MTNIFVITASDPNSQQHVRDTIAESIPPDKVEKHFEGDELALIRALGQKHGYHAWGALPGPGNIQTWTKLNTGDYILVYQHRFYTYYSRVIYKTINSDFATYNWGISQEGHLTWDHIYFLERPHKIAPPVPVSKLTKYLPEGYRGFIRLSDDRVTKIVEEFGDLDRFFEAEFIKQEPVVTSPLSIWWVNQGESYTEDRGKKFIWAPLKSKDGTRPGHWATIESVKSGDVIFNYASGALRGISIAKDKGYRFDNEESDVWNKEGTRVDIGHFSIDPIPIANIKVRKAELFNCLQGKVAPFEKEGDIKQGYLFEFNLEAGRIIREIYGKPFPDPIERIFFIKDPGSPRPNEVSLNLVIKKGQIIFYGPSGTGKTFHTKRIAIDIIKAES